MEFKRKGRSQSNFGGAKVKAPKSSRSNLPQFPFPPTRLPHNCESRTSALYDIESQITFSQDYLDILVAERGVFEMRRKLVEWMQEVINFFLPLFFTYFITNRFVPPIISQ